MAHGDGRKPGNVRNFFGKRLTDAVDRIFGNRGEFCRKCVTLGNRQEQTDFPICQYQSSSIGAEDGCKDPRLKLLEPLSRLERQALVIFEECWEQWEIGGGGFGPAFRVCLPYERAESAARSHGLRWSSELKGMLRRSQNLILQQQKERLNEEASIREAERAAEEARRQ